MAALNCWSFASSAMSESKFISMRVTREPSRNGLLVWTILPSGSTAMAMRRPLNICFIMPIASGGASGALAEVLAPAAGLAAAAFRSGMATVNTALPFAALLKPNFMVSSTSLPPGAEAPPGEVGFWLTFSLVTSVKE